MHKRAGSQGPPAVSVCPAILRFLGKTQPRPRRHCGKRVKRKSRKKQEEGRDAPAGEVAALLLSEDVSGNKVVTERHLSIGTDYLLYGYSRVDLPCVPWIRKTDSTSRQLCFRKSLRILALWADLSFFLENMLSVLCWLGKD